MKTPNRRPNPKSRTQPAPRPKSAAPRRPARSVPGGDAPCFVPAPKPLPASGFLTVRQLGNRFGKSRFTIYRWITNGVIPDRFLQYRGMREMLISVEAVEHLRASFREMHG